MEGRGAKFREKMRETNTIPLRSKQNIARLHAPVKKLTLEIQKFLKFRNLSVFFGKNKSNKVRAIDAFPLIQSYLHY